MNLQTIMARQLEVLNAGAVSSQTDPASIRAFAELTMQAFACVSDLLDVSNSEQALAARTDLQSLAVDASTIGAELEHAMRQLEAVRKDTADAAATVETLRGQLAELMAQAGELKP